MTAISVKDLGVSLAGMPILKEVSFTIEDTETVALLGANGSGKSTLIRTILGFYPRHLGEVEILGTPIASFTSWDQIGYVPQKASISLHSTTVAEVVASGVLANRSLGWFTRQNRRQVSEALGIVDLEEFAGEPFLHLSGGQQQRVLIARGIVNHPRLIIMDEPFAGVDAANQRAIAATLATLTSTVLVVLHETGAFTDLIDRTLVLHQGRLLRGHRGPPEPHTGHETQRMDHYPRLTSLEPGWTS